MSDILAVAVWAGLATFVYNEIYRFSNRRLLLPLAAGALVGGLAAVVRLLAA